MKGLQMAQSSDYGKLPRTGFLNTDNFPRQKWSRFRHLRRGGLFLVLALANSANSLYYVSSCDIGWRCEFWAAAGVRSSSIQFSRSPKAVSSSVLFFFFFFEITVLWIKFFVLFFVCSVHSIAHYWEMAPDLGLYSLLNQPRTSAAHVIPDARCVLIGPPRGD